MNGRLVWIKAKKWTQAHKCKKLRFDSPNNNKWELRFFVLFYVSIISFIGRLLICVFVTFLYHSCWLKCFWSINIFCCYYSITIVKEKIVIMHHFYWKQKIKASFVLIRKLEFDWLNMCFMCALISFLPKV